MNILEDDKIKLLFRKIIISILVFLIISAVIMSVPLKYSALVICLCALCMVLVILFFLYRYLDEQNRIMQKATVQITEYISGNQDARIECNEEGELYKMFHKVNSLAAILNAHAENEWKAKESLKHTISDISHQLKTPLAALNIYNGIMQEGMDDFAIIEKFIKLSEQELHRIETLVQNLLKMAKLDAGTIILDKKMEDLSNVMNAVEKHFLYRAEQEGKEMCLKGNPDIMLFCDPHWLVEAIDNIVKNAMDHTMQGERIMIEWKQFASVIQIMIKDNGKGIHPEDLPFIFKRFYRSRYSKDTQGIGLGLSLAKSIIESHNGSIEVDSKLGLETTFIISFLIPTKL
ncbi:sensor histidine kinase [Lachnospiraceae bacterium LCP25S3_G4]